MRAGRTPSFIEREEAVVLFGVELKAMTTQTIAYVTPDEYLAAERLSESRSEYLDGVVCPMTGASFKHIQVVSNITAELSVQLRTKPCSVLPIDLKVRLPDSRKFFYPDVTVVCGELQFHDKRRDVILNPPRSEEHT